MPTIGYKEESQEKFESSVDTLINELLQQNFKKIRKPILPMKKEDELQIILDLEENGVFLIKGSPKRLLRELNVSLEKVYK